MYVSMYLKEAENKISIRNTTVRIDHMYVSLDNKVKKRLYYYNCNWIVKMNYLQSTTNNLTNWLNKYTSITANHISKNCGKKKKKNPEIEDKYKSNLMSST